MAAQIPAQQAPEQEKQQVQTPAAENPEPEKKVSLLKRGVIGSVIGAVAGFVALVIEKMKVDEKFDKIAVIIGNATDSGHEFSTIKDQVTEVAGDKIAPVAEKLHQAYSAYVRGENGVLNQPSWELDQALNKQSVMLGRIPGGARTVLAVTTAVAAVVAVVMGVRKKSAMNKAAAAEVEVATPATQTVAHSPASPELQPDMDKGASEKTVRGVHTARAMGVTPPDGIQQREPVGAATERVAAARVSEPAAHAGVG